MIKLLTIIFGPIITDFRETRSEIKNLDDKFSFRFIVIDFMHVARNTGFVLIPALLSGFVFLLLPQGRDTLLLVIEKLAVPDFAQFLWFLVAIAAWSVASELSVRYAIAITDNSGKSLRDSRVYARKLSQRLLAAFSLFWPGLMVIISLIFCWNTATYLSPAVKIKCFGIFIGSLLLLLRFFSYWYFHRYPRVGNDPAMTPMGARSLPKSEYNWVNRLYGIYNEYVYAILKPSNFVGKYRTSMQGFANHLIHLGKDKLEKFLQNEEVMNDIRVLPEKFTIVNRDYIITDKGDSYKWRYDIPNSFFPKFHKQLLIMVGLSVFVLLTFAFLPAKSGYLGIVGAPALLCFAFACYSGIYSGLLFIDYGLLRKNFLPVRWLLFFWLLVVSCINHDHPVNMGTTLNKPRNTLSGQFSTWFADYKTNLDSVKKGTEVYPVIFICAEGGALRTGAYTSIFLTKLQRELNNEGIDIKRSIFLMSGVSGGSLGLAYYNAQAFDRNRSDSRSGGDVDAAVRFYKYDSLSPIIGKMCFGEFINLFLPNHVKNFDRSIALEDSWEQAYRQSGPHASDNRFGESFVDGRQDPLQPGLVINTTEIESGYQCWISNLRPDTLLYQPKRDLLQQKVKEVSYSTAIDFSTRFPLLSPAAEIDTAGGRLHYIDGGYVENTGAGSMVEMLNLLDRKVPAFKNVKPIVIYLRFSNNDNAQAKNIHFANELTEIVSGIYNTRVGRSFTALAQLNQFVKNHHGIIIDEPLSKNDRDVPMNWMLSDQSMKNIISDVDEKLKDRSPKGIRVKLFEAGLRYLSIKMN